jgi:hypothetical protein
MGTKVAIAPTKNAPANTRKRKRLKSICNIIYLSTVQFQHAVSTVRARRSISPNR